MTNDLTFFTNDNGRRLIDRFKTLFKDTKELDVIVGYFYLSGLYQLEKELEKVDKIRIIVGMQTGREIIDLVEKARNVDESKNEYLEKIVEELSSGDYEDTLDKERAIRKFISWISNGKLEIKYYPHSPLHAKLYIFRSRSGIDLGRVITGSSNFTISGLKDNLEFNVELKNRGDVEFAIERFDELWEKCVDISEDIVKTVKKKTWLNDELSPYELYLKFLYEFLKDYLDYDKQDFNLPDGFKKLKYQLEAVADAEAKLKEHGGVFLSDVVGLGKTFITAMLLAKLQKKVLVFSPPHLVEYWEDVLRDFGVRAKVVSSGRLRNIDPMEFIDYEVVIVDEAHRFRNEGTQGYENLHMICKGKKVILVTATPYNNRPSDIKNQLLLFQDRYCSTIPGVTNLEDFFSHLENKIKKVNRKKNPEKYREVLKSCGEQIRTKILQFVMVRRTRKEVEKFFKDDLKAQNVSFPKVEQPKRIYYVLNKELDNLYNKTIGTIADLSYARYKPALYLKTKLKENDPEFLSQKNLTGLMKTLLLKRLESSFEAFRNTLKRFLSSHEQFIKMFEEHRKLYISKEVDVYRLLEEDNIDELLKLIEEESVKEYDADELLPEFYENLKNDTETIKSLLEEWQNVKEDPKLTEFTKLLEKDSVLSKAEKLLVFTEFSDTADYLGEKLKEKFGDCVLVYSSKSPNSVRKEIIKNFDPNAKRKKNDIRILITTDVLAEGINLHRSNVIVNYDIPWNPTKVLQRVGRINRVGSSFNKIYIYNFFPVGVAEKELGLEAAAVAKLQAFHQALGEDAKYLTEDEEVNAHGLFNKINEIEENGDGEEKSFIKYVNLLRELRDSKPEVFERIKRLPKKSRSGRNFRREMLVTLFKKGKLKKIYLSYKEKETKEIDFFEAIELLETTSSEKKIDVPLESYYELFEKNKSAFSFSLKKEVESSKSRRTSSRTEKKLKKELKALKNSLDSESKIKVQALLDILNRGAMSMATVKSLNKKLSSTKDTKNKLRIVCNFLQEFERIFVSDVDYVKDDASIEVILSQYFGN